MPLIDQMPLAEGAGDANDAWSPTASTLLRRPRRLRWLPHRRGSESNHGLLSDQETVDAEVLRRPHLRGRRKFGMLNWVAAPKDSKGFEPHNRLLAALSGSDLQSLQPYIEAVPLARGSVLFEVGEPLTRVCFVESGVVSLLTAFYNRVPVGVGPVGREGAVGVGSLLLGGDTALGRYQVLVPGSALTMEIPAFRRALGQRPKLRMACEAGTRARLVQLLQAVPCTRLHTVEQRCARWLLMCADRTEDDTFELTQECFAEMLGVPDSRGPPSSARCSRRGWLTAARTRSRC